VPYTPFHVLPVWPLWKRWPQRLDFIALTVGCVIPDLFEPVFFFAWGDSYWLQRSLSHSLLGAVTYDLALAVLGILLARRLLSWLDRIHPSTLWRWYGGLDFRTPRAWSVVIASAVVGTVSHVLLDLPFHHDNPLFFPFGETIHNDRDLDLLLPYPLAHILVALLFLVLLYVHWWRPAHRQTAK